MSAPVPPHRSKGVLLFCALLWSLPCPAQDATDPTPDTLPGRRDEARKSREEYARQLPAIEKPVRIRDIFTVERDKDGQLSLTTTLGAQMSRGPTWIKVEGDPGIITATVFGYTGPTAPFGLQFIR